MYCWTEPGNGCRICIGSGLWEVRTPKVHSVAGELFGCVAHVEFSRHFDLLCRDCLGGMGSRRDRCDPPASRTLGPASTSRFLPGRRELICEKLIAMRGKITTRYTVEHVAAMLGPSLDDSEGGFVQG